MCWQHEELLPTWKAQRFPFFSRNFGSFLFNSEWSIDQLLIKCYWLAHITPAPFGRLHVAHRMAELDCAMVGKNGEYIARLSFLCFNGLWKCHSMFIKLQPFVTLSHYEQMSTSSTHCMANPTSSLSDGSDGTSIPSPSNGLMISSSAGTVSCTKHVWYSEHGTYYWFKIILERAMSATHVAVIPRTRTHPDKEEFPKKWLSWRE